MNQCENSQPVSLAPEASPYFPDSDAPIVYQVFFRYTETGRRVPRSKRALTFRLGVAQDRDDPTDFTVVVVWSLRSGKLRVSVDDQPVPVHLPVAVPAAAAPRGPSGAPKTTNASNSVKDHGGNSTAGRREVDVSWTLRFPQCPYRDSAGLSPPQSAIASSAAPARGGRLGLRYLAQAAAPAPPLRQYDLLIDGCSFFQLPRRRGPRIRGVAAAGLGTASGKSNRAPPVSAESPRNPVPVAPSLRLAANAPVPRMHQEDEAFLEEALRRSRWEAAMALEEQRQWHPGASHWLDASMEQEEKVDVERELEQQRRDIHPRRRKPEYLRLSDSFDGVEPIA